MTDPSLLRDASLRGRLLTRDEWYNYRESFKCRLVARLGCPLLMCWPEERADLDALVALMRRACAHTPGAVLEGVTSIGCGCGVVEWLLAEHFAPLSVHGIDACLCSPFSLTTHNNSVHKSACITRVTVPGGKQLCEEAKWTISYGCALDPETRNLHRVRVPREHALAFFYPIPSSYLGQYVAHYRGACIVTAPANYADEEGAALARMLDATGCWRHEGSVLFGGKRASEVRVYARDARVPPHEAALRTTLVCDRRGMPWLTDALVDALLHENNSDDEEEVPCEERPAPELERLYATHAPHALYWMARRGLLPLHVAVRGDDADTRALVARIRAARAASPRYALLADADTAPVRTLAAVLHAWAQRGTHPLPLVPMHLLHECECTDAAPEGLLEAVRAFDAGPSAGETAGPLLRALGAAGLRACLGLRTTAGTARDVLPPSLLQLVAAFRRRHSEGTATLTVGARALAKHCERARDGWWGDGLHGTEAEKNARADDRLVAILAQPAWANVHALPHDVLVYEVRNEAGYGARWECAPPFRFRGFLEPQMEDGHALGWVH